MNHPVNAHPEHDCRENEAWRNQDTATMNFCLICGHINQFTFKSWGDKLRNLFWNGVSHSHP